MDQKKIKGLFHATLGVKILCFDRSVGWKLKTDGDSPSSWQGFIPRGTTRPSHARKHKPHRPWKVPFCHRDFKLRTVQTVRPRAWTESLKRSFVSSLYNVLLGSLWTSLAGKADVLNAEIMQTSAFTVNHLASITKIFFSLSLKVQFFLCGYCLAWSPGRMKAGWLIMYQNITQNHWLTFTVESTISYLTNSSCENSIVIKKTKPQTHRTVKVKWKIHTKTPYHNWYKQQTR